MTVCTSSGATPVASGSRRRWPCSNVRLRPEVQVHRMSKRWRYILIGLVVAFIAIEIGLSFLRPPQAYVEVANKAAAPMENVSAGCDGQVVRLSDVPPGGTIGFSIGARKPTVLILDYKQKGSIL